ncbi:Kiwa anti-phage protein KwaB-like domain-containing protein [Achromobacter kerstersii]
MTTAQDLRGFGAFDVSQSTASLWIFKKRPATGQMNPFTAVSVLMSDALRDELKELARNYQISHTLAEQYGLLSQTSEGGFLAVSRGDTLFPNLQGLIDQPLEECLVKNVKQLNNAAGYVLRLRHGATVVYCIKKANADWATRKKKGVMNIFFNEAGLDIMDNPSFSISRSFDFFVTGESVLMTNKQAFESLLNHKDTYEEAYTALKQEAGFSAAIADFTIFDSFIGKNATHLRRMAVIKARGYYNNPDYMTRLREINGLREWGIQFDEQGRIVATAEKMRDILHVLLDHRLRSELSDNQYDVPSTTPVGH